jgi:CheY-like chemotaxis protein
MLRFKGHEVRTAHDGSTGVAAAAECRPHLILLDLGMETMDGCEAACRIRAAPSGARPFLVALTGWGADDDRRRTRDAGFDRHLVKPVDLDRLVKLIAELPVESL